MSDTEPTPFQARSYLLSIGVRRDVRGPDDVRFLQHEILHMIHKHAAPSDSPGRTEQVAHLATSFPLFALYKLPPSSGDACERIEPIPHFLRDDIRRSTAICYAPPHRFQNAYRIAGKNARNLVKVGGSLSATKTYTESSRTSYSGENQEARYRIEYILVANCPLLLSTY